MTIARQLAIRMTEAELDFGCRILELFFKTNVLILI